MHAFLKCDLNMRLVHLHDTIYKLNILSTLLQVVVMIILFNSMSKLVIREAELWQSKMQI
jgi:hypothetical protein